MSDEQKNLVSLVSMVDAFFLKPLLLAYGWFVVLAPLGVPTIGPLRAFGIMALLQYAWPRDEEGTGDPSGYARHVVARILMFGVIFAAIGEFA